MRILYCINYFGLGADRWISSDYRDAFEDLGHEFFYATADEDLAKMIRGVRPHIIFLFLNDFVRERRNWEFFRNLRSEGTKVFLFVDHRWQSDGPTVELYQDSDVADVYWGYIEKDWMEDFMKKTGRSYIDIPLAANRKYHFPTQPVPKYECDITFLGANLPLKRNAFKRLLFPLKRRYRVKIYGQDWTLKDRFLHIAVAGLRRLNEKKLSAWINSRRIAIPKEEENQLYSSAKISINIHEEGPELERHIMLNGRGFKIPACGGFEICDSNPALRRHFSEKEVVMAENEEDWFRKIDYYLHHETERVYLRQEGTARALRDHTYHERVRRIFSLAGFTA